MNETLQLLQFRPAPFFRTPVENQRRDDRRQADRENAARNGYSEHRVNSRGVGTIRPAAPLMFDIPFLNEPHYTTGFALVHNPDPAVWTDPTGGLGVRMWVRNEKGHYVGAHIYVTVAIHAIDAANPPATYPDTTMVHFATFSGMAFKDLGTKLTSAAQHLRPRVPGFGAGT